jgi:hypothetical protein
MLQLGSIRLTGRSLGVPLHLSLNAWFWKEGLHAGVWRALDGVFEELY